MFMTGVLCTVYGAQVYLETCGYFYKRYFNKNVFK